MLQRADVPYQPFYCEENVWQLCRHPAMACRTVFVVFIFGRASAIPLWHQRAARSPEWPVFWDYHAVLMTTGRPSAAVWDLDSVLDWPVPLEAYLAATFKIALPEVHAPIFRVVNGGDFLATFSSDRSHMRDAKGGFIAPPPPWPAPARGPSNLRDFTGRGNTLPGRLTGLAGMTAFAKTGVWGTV